MARKTSKGEKKKSKNTGKSRKKRMSEQSEEKNEEPKVEPEPEKESKKKDKKDKEKFDVYIKEDTPVVRLDPNGEKLRVRVIAKNTTIRYAAKSKGTILVKTLGSEEFMEVPRDPKYMQILNGACSITE